MLLKYININDISDDKYLRALSIMSDDRKLSVARKKKQSDRNLSIAGEMLARECIAEITKQPEEKITFLRGEHGKPYVTLPDIYFNFSHSEEYAVCAAGSNQVGIDVEKIRPVNTNIAKKCCTEKESTYVFENRDDNSETYRRLITIWTLKEAYFKCIGIGISTNLKTVEFSVTEHTVTCSDNNYAAKLDYSIDGYIIAICEKTK